MSPSFKSYLSIDLDYWHKNQSENNVVSFFAKVLRLNLPILVVESHEVLLESIDNCESRVLYNVDFHSDFIGDKTKEGFEEQLKKGIVDANWVNYVQWRQYGEYVWLHPVKECYHDKDFVDALLQEGSGACWGTQEDNPFENAFHDWYHVRHHVGTSQIKWRTICGVGVSLSQDYLLGNYHIFDNLMDTLKIKKRLNHY